MRSYHECYQDHLFFVRLGISYIVHQSLLLTVHAEHNTQLLDSSGRKRSRRHGDLVLLQILNKLFHSGSIFRILGVVGSIPFYDLFFAKSAVGHKEYQHILIHTKSAGVDMIWLVNKRGNSTTKESLGQCFWTLGVERREH